MVPHQKQVELAMVANGMAVLLLWDIHMLAAWNNQLPACFGLYNLHSTVNAQNGTLLFIVIKKGVPGGKSYSIYGSLYACELRVMLVSSMWVADSNK